MRDLQFPLVIIYPSTYWLVKASCFTKLESQPLTHNDHQFSLQPFSFCPQVLSDQTISSCVWSLLATSQHNVIGFFLQNMRLKVIAANLSAERRFSSWIGGSILASLV